MVAAARLEVHFSASGIEVVNNAVDGLNVKLGLLGVGMKVAGQKMTDMVTRPIVNFLSEAYMGAASLEQAMGKVDAVYKESAGSILTWAENSARGFGQSKKEALDMAGTYGQIMQAQGMAIDESATYSKSLVELAADMSAFTDISIDRSNLALRGALTGEYESLKQFGIVLKAADVEMEAHNIALEHGTSEVTEYHRQLARLRIIQRQTNTMTGQFGREADGASGSLAILRAQWKDLTTQLGQVLLPIGTKITGMLSGFITALKSLPTPITSTIVVVAALVAAIGPLLSIVGMMAIGIAALPAAFTAVAATATAFMGALVPLLPVIAAVAAAVGLLFLAYKNNFLGFGTLVDGAIGKLKEFFGFSPDTKTFTTKLDTDLTGEEDAWNNWTKMPDGTWKHATLGITTTGVDATVSWVVNPDSPDGKDWSLNVDVDGDGLPDAMKIIDSVDQGGGKFVMTTEVDGTKYEVWYDSVTGQAIILPMEAELVNEREIENKLSAWEKTKRFIKFTFELGGGDTLITILKQVNALIESAIASWQNLMVLMGVESQVNSPESQGTMDRYNWESQSRQEFDMRGSIVEGENWSPKIRTITTDLGNLINVGKVASTTLGTDFNGALVAVDREMQKTASTTPMIGRGFLGASTDSKTASGEMQGAFGALSRSASTETQSVSNSFATNMASANTQAVAQMLGMRVSASLQMALMAADASTKGSLFSSNLGSGITGAMGKVTGAMANVAASIALSGATAISTAYTIGANISQGFANGMLAYLGTIRNAATAMVNAASTALIAKAMISSPSKLFYGYGEYVGEGFERGILATIPDVMRATGRLVGAPDLGFATSGAMGMGGATVIDQSAEYYITLNDEQFAGLLAARDKANSIHAVMTDPNSASQYRKVGGR